MPWESSSLMAIVIPCAMTLITYTFVSYRGAVAT